jgi:hypothetical protein
MDAHDYLRILALTSLLLDEPREFSDALVESVYHRQAVVDPYDF